MTDASGGGDAAIARIKTQHYFTEADEIPAALVSRFDFHRHRLILMGYIPLSPPGDHGLAARLRSGLTASHAKAPSAAKNAAT